jgi:hypothetical protein
MHLYRPFPAKARGKIAFRLQKFTFGNPNIAYSLEKGEATQIALNLPLPISAERTSKL